jgi:excisionase family DNA binding protein
MDELLTTEEVAAYFRTVPGTVRYWRHVGKGPRALKVGKRVLYRAEDVRAWAEQALTTPAA